MGPREPYRREDRQCQGAERGPSESRCEGPGEPRLLDEATRQRQTDADADCEHCHAAEQDIRTGRHPLEAAVWDSRRPLVSGEDSRTSWIAVAQPVKRPCKLGAPATQRGALGDQLVRTAEPGVLEHRKQYIIGVSCRRAAAVGLVLQCRFKWGCDRAELGEPIVPSTSVSISSCSTPPPRLAENLPHQPSPAARPIPVLHHL